jgi:hypothetical protein
VSVTDQRYTPVDAADNLPCRPDFAMMVYPWESVVEAPVNAPNGTATAPLITKDNPPTMLIQAEDDPVHVEVRVSLYRPLPTHRTMSPYLHV